MPLPLEAVYAQIRKQEVVLRVQQLVRLRKAEGVRRFEVLLRHMVDGEETSPERVMQTAANHGLASMIDRRVIGELIAWLHRNPTVWKKDPPAFSVNLSDAAVIEPHFISFVESCLQKSGLPPGLIGVEFSERVCLTHPDEVVPALDVFARIGVPVAIDDFNVVGAGMPILDHPAVRLLKIDAELTTNALAASPHAGARRRPGADRESHGITDRREARDGRRSQQLADRARRGFRAELRGVAAGGARYVC